MTTLSTLLEKITPYRNRPILVVQAEERDAELGPGEHRTIYVHTRELCGILIAPPRIEGGVLYLPTDRYIHAHQANTWTSKEGNIVVAEYFLDHLDREIGLRDGPKPKTEPHQRSLRVLGGKNMESYFGAGKNRYQRAIALIEPTNDAASPLGLR